MKVSSMAELYPPSTRFYETEEARIPRCYTDTEEEIRTLRTGTGLIDGTGFAILRVCGNDSGAFLDSLCSKDILYTVPGECTEGLLLDEEGRVISIVWVLEQGPGYYVMLPPEKAAEGIRWITSRTMKALDYEDLKVERLDPGWSMLFLEGRQAGRMICSVLREAADTISLHGAMPVLYEKNELILIRIGRTGENAYACLGERDATARLAMELLTRYEKDGLALCGEQAVRICMMEISQPSADLAELAAYSVFELGWQWLVQYDKEGFCGDEALEKQFKNRSRTRVCFQAEEGGMALAGCGVYLDQEQEGVVLEDCYDPSMGKRIGTVLLKNEVGVPGICLKVKSPDENGSTETVIETVSSPIVRPASWDDPLEDS